MTADLCYDIPRIKDCLSATRLTNRCSLLDSQQLNNLRGERRCLCDRLQELQASLEFVRDNLFRSTENLVDPPKTYQNSLLGFVPEAPLHIFQQRLHIPLESLSRYELLDFHYMHVRRRDKCLPRHPRRKRNRGSLCSNHHSEYIALERLDNRS